MGGGLVPSAEVSSAGGLVRMDVRHIKKSVRTAKERLQVLNEIFFEYHNVATKFEIVNDPLFVEVWVWLE